MHSHPAAADTLIIDAQLYDGTGAPPVERDVAVRDGKIVAIGNLSNWLAEELIEANGRALATTQPPLFLAFSSAFRCG